MDKRRLDEWNENVLKQLVNARFAPTASREAYLAGWATDLGHVQIGRVRSSSGMSSRDRALVTATEDDRFNLLVPAGRGEVSTVQSGNEVRVSHGGIAMVRMDETADVQFHGANDSYLVFVPKRELLARFPRFNDRDAAKVLQGGAVTRMIGSYLQLVESQDEQSLSLLGGVMSNHVVDLILLALAPSGDNKDAAQNAQKAAKLGEVRSYVRSRFAAPDASLDHCAKQVGCSRSFIQKLLADAGTSFSDLLRECRVTAACSMMGSTDGRHRALIDVAHSCGFSDLSTFYRSFKALKGTTPGDYRASRPASPG